MGIIALLSLFSATMMYAAYEIFDDEDSAPRDADAPEPDLTPEPAPEPEPEPEPEPVPVDVDFSFDEDRVVVVETSASGATETSFYDFDGEWTGSPPGIEVDVLPGADPDFVVNINAGDGDDTLTIGEGLFGRVQVGMVQGGAGDDSITSQSATRIEGGAGDDTIRLDAFGDTTLVGGTGDDLIIAEGIGTGGYLGDGDLVDGGDGDDTLLLGGGPDFDIILGNGADTLVLSPELRDALEPITVADFDPSEDNLVFVTGQAKAALGIDEITEDDYSVTITQNMAENRTEIEFYAVPRTDLAFGVLLYLEGAPEVTEDMITVLITPLATDFIAAG